MAPSDTIDRQPDEQWDLVTTIKRLEVLRDLLKEAVERTEKKLGKHHGTDIEGRDIIEHPLGQAIFAVDEALRACYARYGSDLFRGAQVMERIGQPPRKRRTRGTKNNPPSRGT